MLNFLKHFFMAAISKFEDMLAWQKARSLNKLIYIESNEQEFSKDYALKDQIRKSSISIMSNIAEGFERNNNKEFKYFLNVAKGSAGELRAQLYIAFDLGYITNEYFQKCQNLALEISRMLNGFINYLQKSVVQDSRVSKNKIT